jgi:hypothetical protein
MDFTHFLHAYDTIFFLKAHSQNVDFILRALYAFEAPLGMKINYHKTELVPINVPHEEALHCVALLDCKLTSFPFNT